MQNHLFGVKRGIFGVKDAFLGVKGAFFGVNIFYFFQEKSSNIPWNNFFCYLIQEPLIPL